MKLPISERLLACCEFVAKGDRVADIGCDHGYLGIHLLTNCIASHMIESDVVRQQMDTQITVVTANIRHPVALRYKLATGQQSFRNR